MAAKSMKNKAASAMVWTGLQKYSVMFVHFVSSIILARLLTPYDYGCIGMLSIFMVLADTFIDSGFGSALIQKKRPIQADYSTVFWWNLGMAVLMYATLYLTAPAISRFYKLPELSTILRVQGLILFVHALNAVQRNQLKKQLNFRLLSIVAISSCIFSILVTIFLAYKGFGVWALVAQNFASAIIPTTVFWFYVKWRPKILFSIQSFKELFSFGVFMFLTYLLNRLGSKIQGLLIGKFFSPDTMGYYSKGENTEKLASSTITSVVMQVTYPLYAEAQDKKAQLINMIKRTSTTLAYLTFPLLFILILCAKPLFVLLYSEKWVASVPYFQVLCVAGFAGCLQSVNLQSISAIGKSKVMFIWTVIKRIVGLGAMLAGFFAFGMKGLLGGVVFNQWFSWFVNICLVDKYVGYKLSRQLLDLLPVILASTVAAAAAYFAGQVLDLGMYQDGILKLLVYLAVYLGWSIIFKPEAYTFFLSAIPARFRFWEKINNAHSSN